MNSSIFRRWKQLNRRSSAPDCGWQRVQTKDEAEDLAREYGLPPSLWRYAYREDHLMGITLPNPRTFFFISYSVNTSFIKTREQEMSFTLTESEAKKVIEGLNEAVFLIQCITEEVQKYLPPDGIPLKAAMHNIIGHVDGPHQRHATAVMKDAIAILKSRFDPV